MSFVDDISLWIIIKLIGDDGIVVDYDNIVADNDDDDTNDDGDIYIMMKCVSVCHENHHLPLPS